MTLSTTAFDLAQRFVGLRETPGAAASPQVLAMLKLDDAWPTDDAVPWCSAFANYVAWLLRLPRSKSLAARSWLGVGRPIALDEAKAENDVVVLSRGDGGHVGFFAGLEDAIVGGHAVRQVLLLGGNQADGVNVSAFPVARVLGVRRLTA